MKQRFPSLLRAEVDSSGMGYVMKVVVDGLIVWSYAPHMDGPLNQDALRLFEVLLEETIKEKESRRGKWYANWAIHNLIAHPLSEIMHWLHLGKLGGRLHDLTVPPHEPGTGRG